jgi:DNA-binding beta-propeller fold protein YncE
MVFGPDGNLYVSEARQLNSTIHRFDGVTGAFLGEFVNRGQGGLYNAGDLVFGPDGNLYVANHTDVFPDVPFSSNSIKRYDGRTGAFLGDFVLPGSGGLGSPTALLFVTPVSEPASVLLLALGTLGAIAWAWRRRGRKGNDAHIG